MKVAADCLARIPCLLQERLQHLQTERLSQILSGFLKLTRNDRKSSIPRELLSFLPTLDQSHQDVPGMNLEIDLLQDRNLQDGTHRTETLQMRDVTIVRTAMVLQMVIVPPALQMTNLRRLLQVPAVTDLLIELVTEVTDQASNRHHPSHDLSIQIMVD